jgi:hypothetical protein
MVKPTVKLSEKDIKNACESLCYSLMNMGKMVYLRLNSGKIIIGDEGHKRAVVCCPMGTSDGILIFPNPTRVIFIEYKSPTGKQTREQVEFCKKVEEQGHLYWLVSDFDAFKDVITEELKIGREI